MDERDKTQQSDRDLGRGTGTGDCESRSARAGTDQRTRVMQNSDRPQRNPRSRWLTASNSPEAYLVRQRRQHDLGEQRTLITTYTYDYGNRLTEVTQGGTIIATYVYDALDRRIGIDDSGTQTWTVYDGTNPYADFNGSGTLQVRYLFGPGVVDGAVVDELLRGPARAARRPGTCPTNSVRYAIS